MIKKLTPVFVFCITAAILMGCSSSDPLIGEAESNIKDENFEAALTASEKYIQQNPQNPLGYYYKGVALGQKGQNQTPPSESIPFYKQMDEAFTEAKQKAENAEEVPSQLERIPTIKNTIWQTEHNRAVEFATNDSLMKATEEPLDMAVAHLNNATIVQPDSVLSWEVLAQVNNMRKNYGEAAQAQRQVIEMTSNPEAKAYLLLAQFYRLSDQPEEAINVLESARDELPENNQIVEVLADSYSQTGQSEKAIATVEELVNSDPKNPQYRLSLGTQIYKSVLEVQNDYDENLDEMFKLQQELKNASGSEANKLKQQVQQIQQENTELEQEINSLTDRAVTELNAVLENRPDDADAYNTLGIIYQNKAAVVFDKRNMTTDNQQAKELDQQAKNLLEKAMTNYEKAAEIDPDNQDYWRSLFQVYTALGMDEKAKEAEQKAGMN